MIEKGIVGVFNLFLCPWHDHWCSDCGTIEVIDCRCKLDQRVVTCSTCLRAADEEMRI